MSYTIRLMGSTGKKYEKVQYDSSYSCVERTIRRIDFFLIVFFTLYQARESLAVEGYRIRGNVYADMRGR